MCLIVFACGAAAALGGCVTGSARIAPPPVQAQGQAWELVLPTPAAAEQFTRADPAMGRRDLALSAVPRRELTALEKPTTPVPTLSRQRFLHLPRTSDRFIFFERSSRGTGHPLHPRHGRFRP